MLVVAVRAPKRCNGCDGGSPTAGATRAPPPYPRSRTKRALVFVHPRKGPAVPERSMPAVLENFQDEGGAVSVPEVLVGFGAPARIEARR